MPITPAENPNSTLGAMHLGPLATVSESEPIAAVAALFRSELVSCAVLVESPLRVVTEYDLAMAWAEGREAQDAVGDIATSHPCWAPISASVAETAALMVSLGIRHLVVLDISDKPIGIVSMPELFSVLVRAQEPMALYASFADLMLTGASDQGRRIRDNPPHLGR